MESKPIKIVKKNPSVFQTEALEDVVARLEKQIQDLYCSDKIPWVVGYSGGKDSTATLQLVWNAVKNLPKEKRTKEVIERKLDPKRNNCRNCSFLCHKGTRSFNFVAP